jgi:hypothetical protein
MTATFTEIYNGYWVSGADRKPRNFLWENTMIADSNMAIFIAQTVGAGRGQVKVKLTFDGLIENAEGEGIWMYDRDRWFWRMTFKDQNGKEYVFITFKEPRGPVPYDSFRTSVFGVLYDRTSIVGYVRWRITFKEVSRLYKTIKPFKSEIANILYRTGLMYPTILGAGAAYSVVSWGSEFVKSILTYGFTFYMGEISSEFANSDYMMPYPFEEGLTNDLNIQLAWAWQNPT